MARLGEKKNTAMTLQKAKLKWLKEGDENIKFFHLASKARERKIFIHGLTIDDMWTEDQGKIKSHTLEFFKRKFAKRNDYAPKLKMHRLPKLTEEEAADLEKSVSEEEVFNAIKVCGKNKSSGPDGFTIEFLNRFWGIIKSNLIAVVEWFWEKEELSEGCNTSFLTLVPKNAQPMGLGDFRPISLFGRSILDGILIANETIDFLKRSRKKGLTFKVDFKKAYDSVDWSFLLDGLENIRFGRKWRGWIEACLKSSTISVLVNGSPTNEFPMERGLRLPTHSVPFLVIAKCLHIMVEEAIDKGLLKGVKLLECFRIVSGLKMNLGKSKLFGVRIGEEEVHDWERTMECGSGTLPFTYLGLLNTTLGPRDRKTKKKLAAWKSRLISIGRRQNLVKALLSSVSLYYFTLFRASASVLRELERVRCNFFWGGEAFWDGGLSIGGLKELNWGLIEKWWRRFLSEKNGLWVSVIRSLYGNDDGLEGDNGSRGRAISSVWATIAKTGRDIDSVGVLFSGTKFWDDRWAGSERLRDRFARLYLLESVKEVSVRNRGEFEGDSWSWRKEPRGREVGELEELVRGKAWETSNLFGFDNIGVDLDSTLCPRCGCEVESTKHALLECKHLTLLWQQIGSWWNINMASITSLVDFIIEDIFLDHKVKRYKI
ncbi:LOW QUALITY PROTEIN: hypothetical protein OSB04_011344 [Centaurea solstitialis]|uniref:Reverse transcriptase domain-containing protein n=1 Tax=Centaurea solstitialis TaxID=347529 RepID=A0AA38WLF2_9ASTR|nr:LOW QUALITY PROTEIN: hypothetical protein OSB04_011344 [Centaurea solstitialis]